MLLDMLYFVSLPVGQVKPNNNLPKAISSCLEQALISNPGLESGFGLVKKHRIGAEKVRAEMVAPKSRGPSCYLTTYLPLVVEA